MIKFEEKKSHRSSVYSIYVGIDYKTSTLKTQKIKTTET